MTAKVLITGAHGQLGRALSNQCARRGLPFDGRDLDTLDIRDRNEVSRWIGASGSGLVVNCAAFTAVDDCETRSELAMAVNGTAVGHLADACRTAGAVLVHISTDYVFRGDTPDPYIEDDPTDPISVYGRTKLFGEENARRAAEHLIVRTAWLFGRGGPNFVESIRSQIDSGRNALEVVDDQHGCPTFCDDLARAILDLVEIGARGVVHAVNSGITSWHGFAIEIARQLGAAVEIRAVPSSRFPRPAPRPTNSSLDTTRLEQLLGRNMPTWQDALRRYLDHA